MNDVTFWLRHVTDCILPAYMLKNERAFGELRMELSLNFPIGSRVKASATVNYCLEHRFEIKKGESNCCNCVSASFHLVIIRLDFNYNHVWRNVCC